MNLNFRLLKKNPPPKNLWSTVTLALLVTTIIGISLFYITKVYVIDQAEKKIADLLLSHRGIHHYAQQVLRPAVDAYKNEGDIRKDFFAPEVLSSSFIVRNQHQFYNEERLKLGLPELYYKMAANNPRNPVNKADAMEAGLIKRFNENRQLRRIKEIIDINGTKYLYVALPFLENTEPCLRCHGEREDAPADLRAKYHGEGGFNETLGEIRAIISIRAPLEREYFTTYIFVAALLSGVIAILLLFFFNSRLRKLVLNRTDELVTINNELQDRNAELQTTLAEVKTLRGILPICSYCKKVRDDSGYWEQVDVYIHKHSNADISHSICQECMKEHYPEEYEDLYPQKS